MKIELKTRNFSNKAETDTGAHFHIRYIRTTDLNRKMLQHCII